MKEPLKFASQKTIREVDEAYKQNKGSKPHRDAKQQVKDHVMQMSSIINLRA